MSGGPLLSRADTAPEARRTCPVGHRVRDPWALRCPTCGRLMPLRFARTCPNGHLVAGPTRVCPSCGAVLGRRWPTYALGAAMLAAFLILVLLARSADVPGRLIALFEEVYAAAHDWMLSLPLFEP